MSDSPTLIDPSALYADFTHPSQSQSGSGLDSDLIEHADLGEDSYQGSGRLRGRRALITGGDSGIGAATAIAYAREGADVALSYLPEEEADAQRIAELITSAGQKAVLLPGNLTSQDYCENLVRDAHDQLGGLDILVSNGGKQQYCTDITELSSEQFEETYVTNVFALFWLARAAVKLMSAGSSIIATSSVQAYQPSFHLVDYASTKAAINTFCKGLAQQLAPKGIRVNAVAPGPVWTPLQTAGGQPPEDLPEFGDETPLGRPGQPAEVAPAFVFLASNEASFVVGETLQVNGGMPTP